MVKAISIPIAEHTKQTLLVFLQSEVIASQILRNVSYDLATQLGSRKLVAKFILGGFIQ